MPFTSGTYSLPTGNPVVPGTTISSTTTNTTNSDIATALSACLLKDGTQTVTANIPMASHKFTGLSAGTTAGDSVEFAGSPSFTNLAYTGTLTGSTGILNIGSGQIYKDASGNMGIGTSSPGAKLQVTSASNFVGIINSTSATNTSLLTFTDPSTTLSSGLGPVIGSAGNNLIFGRGGVSEYMRIDSSGNVGIGTSSPSTKLTVAGAITITGAFALRGSYGAGAIVTNFAAGDNALAYNTTGIQNTASGVNALQNNTTGNYNTASGLGALASNTTGNNNTASGVNALLSNTTGSYNTASGLQALQSNTTGSYNTASGLQALQNNTTGSYNTASGVNALLSNTTGNNNTASGVSALLNNTTGNNNTASGVSALQNNTTGLGNSAFNPLNSAGTYAPVFNPTVENDRFCMGSTGVTNAYIQVAWTVVSDARDKTNFAPVPHGLDFVNQLQPTAYQFKEDRETDVATGIVRYGFKAQDILALEGDNPVIIDTEDLDKLRFTSDSLIPVLVNAIQELTARLQILEAK